MTALFLSLLYKLYYAIFGKEFELNSNVEIIENFRAYMGSGGYSDNTIKTYCEIAHAYIIFCLDRGNFQDYCYINHYTDFKKREIANTTLNIHVAALKMFYRSMRFNFETTINIDKESVRTFTNDKYNIPSVSTRDIIKLMNHINLYPDTLVDKAVIHLLYATGLRPSEIIYLGKSSFEDFEGRFIVNFYEQKKKRYRAVPFFEKDSIYIVKNYLDSISDYIVPFPKVRKIQYIFQSHSNSIDLSINPRLMRHSFAYRCANVYKLSISELQAVMGHTNPAMSMRYALPHNEDIKLLGVKY